MQDKTPQLNWHEWMQRWDGQQSKYLPEREQRFSAMLDVLEELLPERFVAIDLASGPGSISQRLLSRFPQARCVAVDFDPVLLMLGQQVLGDMQGRLRWVEADLREPAWPDQLEEVQVDAVLSTTALHWLPAQLLVQLYQQLGKLVRPGGVVLNGDHLAFAPHLPTFRTVVEGVQKRRSATPATETDAEDWQTWWNAFEREPGMEPIFAERERRFSNTTHHDADTLVELHEAALRDAGFREVGVIWQQLDNRVVLAVR
ncbi:MAG: class I SAM-dependent methyltransferase [Ktedonobacteraceae bacterium]